MSDRPHGTRVEVGAFDASVETTTTRDPDGRVRISDLRVARSPTIADADRERIGRCLELFESLCVVTESVRHGIPVAVEVAPHVNA